MGTAVVWRATCEPMGGVIGAPTDAVWHRSVWPEWYSSLWTLLAYACVAAQRREGVTVGIGRCVWEDACLPAGHRLWCGKREAARLLDVCLRTSCFLIPSLPRRPFRLRRGLRDVWRRRGSGRDERVANAALPYTATVSARCTNGRRLRCQVLPRTRIMETVSMI